MTTEVLERFRDRLQAAQSEMDDVMLLVDEAILGKQQLELDLKAPAPVDRVGVDNGVVWKETRFGKKITGDMADVDLILKSRVVTWKENTVHGLEAGDVMAGAFDLARQILARKLGRPIKDKHEVNHANFDRLDNRRINLEEVTKSQNQKNKRPHKLQPPVQLKLPFDEPTK